VLNRADLANRPIRLTATEIDDPDILAAQICQAKADHQGATPKVTIAMPDEPFYDGINALFHTPRQGIAAMRIAEDGPSYTAAGCRIIVLR